MKRRKIKAGYVESAAENQLNVTVRPIEEEALVEPYKKKTDIYAFDDIEGARR